MKTGKTVGPALFLILAVLPLAIYAQPLTENYLAAVTLAGQGNFSEAKKIFQEIIAAEPPHERAGRCLNVLKDLEDQKIHQETASHLFQGLAYFYQDKFPEAVAAANLALQINPGYKRAHNSRGGFYFGLGKNDLALADLNRALQLDPEYSGAYYNRGCVYLKIKQYNRAIADFGRALKISPQYASASYNRGIAHFHQGNFLWALADFTRALEINPRLAEAYFNRATVLEELGKDQEAAEAYIKFLQTAYPALSREINYARKRLKVLAK
ncbi:MAG: tetratricopeptide repeat protein [Thermodesulfobacteriota bacterium]